MSSLVGRRALISAAGVLALVLSACSSSGGGSSGASEPSAPRSSDGGSSSALSSLYAEAKKEGSVTFYVSKTLMQLVPAFNKKYPGIKINSLRLASTALATRLTQEQNSNAKTADVVCIADEEFIDKASANGWFDTHPTLPALKTWPKEYYSDGIAKTGFAPVGIAYNTDLVKGSDIPKTWQDLLKPEFKNSAIIVDPRAAPVYLQTTAQWLTAFGPDFLRRLGKQNPRVVKSIVVEEQGVAAGSAKVAMTSSLAYTRTLIEKGAPIKFVQPSPSTGSVYYSAVLKGAEHPAAAQLLLNFLLTKDGQVAFNPGDVSPLGSVGEAIALPEGFKVAPYKQVNGKLDQIVDLLGLA